MYPLIGENMKKILAVLTLLILTFCTHLTPSAAEQDWRTEYITALQDGKAVVTPTPGDGGLAYTPSEEQVLMKAVSKAMEQEASACECMKIAIDLDYNPYDVLKSIYSTGGNVKLDQLCMCATEAGIMKAIIAKAASDALLPTGEPLFDLDEITQSQCLRSDQGLAYTPPEAGLPYTAPLSPLSPIGTDSNNNNNYATKTSTK